MKRIIARPRYGPLAGALVLWAPSWWPTLLPRSWFMQGAVSGVCAAIGWLLGLGVGHLLHRGLGRAGHPVTPPARRVAWAVLAGGAAVSVVPLLLVGRAWQNDQRAVMGMDSVGLLTPVLALVVSLVVLAVLVLIGRLVALAVAAVDRLVGRVIRPVGARLVTAVVVVIAVVFVVGAGRDRFVGWADSSFGLVNETTPEGVNQPDSPALSGSPASLVEWDSLGFQGRGFTGGAPTADDIAEFTGDDTAVLDPIRVYVGLDSAPTTEARIALALDEMERTGAFERSVLVVATATGTGWINPDAARTLEFMHGGDTAIVTLQYSFLPSWIAFVIDPSNASDVGVRLFAAVRERWLEQPAQERPQLIVFGESLGSFGAEAAFDGDGAVASLESIVAQSDGALFVGPTAGNPVYGQLVDQRDAGSPTWRPGLAAVAELRVTNTEDEIDPAAPGWSSPRVLYLHHPTDAVGTWSMATLWSTPGWLERPRGIGIPGAARWFPIVSWVQETADLMAGFSAVPGFGHDYRNELTAAWSAVVPPEGWTPADTARLQEFLELG